MTPDLSSGGDVTSFIGQKGAISLMYAALTFKTSKGDTEATFLIISVECEDIFIDSLQSD